MPTIKTIKPDGTGDYTTLAAWEDFADGQASADQWAECYSGGNLGALVVQTWAATPTFSLYPRVYVADGEGHGGVAGAGAYIETALSTVCVTNQTEFARFEGLRLSQKGLGFHWSAVAVQGIDGVHVSGNLFEGSAPAAAIFVEVFDQTSNANTLVIKNNIVGKTAGSSLNLNVYAEITATILTIDVLNNVFIGTASYYAKNFGTSPSIGGTNHNNHYSAEVSVSQVGGGTVTVTFSHNSCEGTLTSGADNVNTVVRADAFTAGTPYDWTLKADSALLDVGTTTDATTDAAGVARPQGAAFDIGAYEFFSIPVPAATATAAFFGIAAVSRRSRFLFASE